jgi:H+/Cl- antiporter ClcA
MTAAVDPREVLRSRRYIGLLVIAAILGAPIATVAFFFLKVIDLIQKWVFTDLPEAVGFDSEPVWWPVLPLTLAGVLVALAIRYLPGRGGESPADGFKAGGGPPPPAALPGVALAALASIGLGAVVGPEAPLVAIGGGLAYLALRVAKKDAPAQVGAVVAASGSFAAISTLLGSPLSGAFLLMEAIGLGGAMATLVLVPGLLGAGIGALIFTGLDSLTGFGTFSLAIPNPPSVGAPTGSEFGWALAVGVVAAPLCWGMRRLALLVRPYIERQLLTLTPIVGLAVAGLAIAYAEITGHAGSDVLFSGQSALPHLVDNSAAYSAGALVLLAACKGLAFSVSLAAFRGGPTFPAMFIGAAGGVALSHLPGLPVLAGTAIGIGAMTAGMLRLPMTAVLLTSLILGTSGITLMPVTIVAVVVSYVVSEHLVPAATKAGGSEASSDERRVPARPTTSAGQLPAPAAKTSNSNSE